MEFCSESLFLHLCLVQYCLCFSSQQLQCFRFQIEVFDLLGYNLYRVIEMDLLSFSCMWTSSFPGTIHSYATLSQVHFFFCLFIKYRVAIPMSSHIWVFYCIPLVYMFDFVLLPHFSVTTGVFLLVWNNDSLRILLFFFLLRIVYLGFFLVSYAFQDFFSVKDCGILTEITLILVIFTRLALLIL